MRKSLLLIFSLALAAPAWAQKSGSLSSELDALGANKDLLRKAKAIDPENRIRVVQNRDVDRHNRFELGVNYGMNAGGDPYVSTNAIGGQMDFHFTPRWSVGARYHSYSNELTSEGKRVFDDAQARKNAGNNDFRFPDTDYAKDSWLGLISWYPVYGKLNWFDAAITQFDLYLIGGAGQINLNSGSAPLFSAGGGIGIWLNRYMSTRLEARWQGYRDQVYDGSRNINQTVLSATIGFLL